MTGQEELRDLFRRLSLRYDKMNDLLTLRRHRAWKSALADAVFRHGGGAALDVCCGTGDVALRLAALPNVSRVVGLDFCDGMLDVARSRAEYFEGRPDGPKPEFLLGDAYDLPFKSGSFDAAVVSFGLYISFAPPDIMRELLRVLKPGGLVACLDAARPRGAVPRLAFRVVSAAARVFAPGVREDYEFLAGKASAFYTPEELDILLGQLGFRVTLSKPLGFSLASLHIGVKL